MRLGLILVSLVMVAALFLACSERATDTGTYKLLKATPAPPLSATAPTSAIGRGLPDQPWLSHFIRPPGSHPHFSTCEQGARPRGKYRARCSVQPQVLEHVAPSRCDADAMPVTLGQTEFPELLRRPGHALEWVVAVAVQLDANGLVQHATVTKSYGKTIENHRVVRFALNAEALKAANAATYRPKVVHCRAMPSTYIYQITFTGGP